MVTAIRIYLEGGGAGRLSWRPIRAGFGKFLASVRKHAQASGIKVEVIPCGSGPETFKDFRRGVRQNPDAFNVLLVDSESAVTRPRLEHLRLRGWDITDLPQDQCHLMVQTIEAWLIADPDALAEYYGQGFRRNALPQHDDVEAIPKDDLLRKLDQATVKTQKGRYAKIRHCADLLGLLNQDRVRQRARHCDLLITTLEARIRE